MRFEGRVAESMQKPVWMICTTHMFVEVFYLTQVALIPVIVREFQLSLLEASLVAAVPSLVALLMNIPSGLLADRVSVNRLLCISMTIEGFSALLVSQTGNFWSLLVALSLIQIASPLYHMSGLSQIARIAKGEGLSMAMGFHNALGNLGTGAGVISLAIFLSVLGWRWVYVLWAVPILFWGVTLLMSSQLKRTITENTRATSPRDLLKSQSPVLNSALLIFLIVIGIREVASTSVSTFMTTYLVGTRNVSESIADLIFGSGVFVGIVGSLAGGYMGVRLGAKKALSWLILGSMASLSILACVSEVYSLTFAFLLYAFFSYSVWSPMGTIVADITPPGSRGLGYSIYLFAQSLIASITPVLAAGVIELTEIWIIFPFSIAFLLAGTIVLQLLHYPDKGRRPS